MPDDDDDDDDDDDHQEPRGNQEPLEPPEPEPPPPDDDDDDDVDDDMFCWEREDGVRLRQIPEMSPRGRGQRKPEGLNPNRLKPELHTLTPKPELLFTGLLI